MNIEVTEKQRSLIREALESYYYVCKNDSGLYYKLNQINELEKSLIKQSK